MTDIVNNMAQKRYELTMDGYVAYATYKLESNTLYIQYVEAPPALRGTGAAGKLMQAVMDIARAENWKVIPICGYAASWIQRSGKYSDMLA